MNPTIKAPITNWLATHLYKPHPRNDTQLDGAWAPGDSTFAQAFDLEPQGHEDLLVLGQEYVEAMHAKPEFGFPPTIHEGVTLFSMDENHVCLSQLVGIAARFAKVGGEPESALAAAAAKEFIARALDYWDNKSSYFRDGYATMPPKPGDWYLGWTGRARKAAIIFRILADAGELMLAFPQYAPLSGAVSALVSYHLDLLEKSWPLVDAPQGDGMSEDEHFRLFQIAMLYHALKRIVDLRFPQAGRAETLMRGIADVMNLVLFLGADNVWFTPYDLKWPDFAASEAAVGFKRASSVEVHLCGITPGIDAYLAAKYAKEPPAIKTKFAIPTSP